MIVGVLNIVVYFVVVQASNFRAVYYIIDAFKFIVCVYKIHYVTISCNR